MTEFRSLCNCDGYAKNKYLLLKKSSAVDTAERYCLPNMRTI